MIYAFFYEIGIIVKTYQTGMASHTLGTLQKGGLQQNVNNAKEACFRVKK